MFDPRTPEFWVAMSFLAFVALMLYFGVPRLITGALDARADAIRKELDEARRLREEAQELLADYQKKAREAEDEAKAIIDQAKREAEAMANESRKSLQEQVERQGKLAQQKIARAEAQALSEVRATAVDTALAAAEKVLKSRLAGPTGSSLVDQGIRELKGKLN